MKPLWLKAQENIVTMITFTFKATTVRFLLGLSVSSNFMQFPQLTAARVAPLASEGETTTSTLFLLQYK